MRNNSVTHQAASYVDPHAAWEAERLALQPHFDVIEELPDDELPDDVDDQVAALCAQENHLIDKIAATTPQTVTSALALIEALDSYELDIIGTENSWTLSAIEARARAIATIRRRLAEREG